MSANPDFPVMNRLSKTNGQDKVQSISIRNLPVDVDDKMLRSIIPSAKKISSHKQTFFITFSTVKGYTDALRRLRRVDFNGVKVVSKSLLYFIFSINNSLFTSQTMYLLRS